MYAHTNNINYPQDVPAKENTQNAKTILFSLEANNDAKYTTQNWDD